jgi:hypothetical protein
MNEFAVGVGVLVVGLALLYAIRQGSKIDLKLSWWEMHLKTDHTEVKPKKKSRKGRKKTRASTVQAPPLNGR